MQVVIRFGVGKGSDAFRLVVGQRDVEKLGRDKLGRPGWQVVGSGDVKGLPTIEAILERGLLGVFAGDQADVVGRALKAKAGDARLWPESVQVVGGVNAEGGQPGDPPVVEIDLGRVAWDVAAR